MTVRRNGGIGQTAPMSGTPLHLLAEASRDLTATSKRGEKTARLAELFAAIDPTDVEVVVGLMLGQQRQGRIGIGWATVGSLELIPATAPSLTVTDIDDMLTEVATISGEGSTSRRADALRSVLHRATADEMDFMAQVLVGDVRQGALAGVISDGVAMAAGVGKPLLRRATMLRGDLGATAAIALSQGAEGLGSGHPRGGPTHRADAGRAPRRRWSTPSAISASPRSSGSSMAPASRCIATATTSGSTPAT